MTVNGTVAAIRAEAGNLRYEYYQSLDDPETVLAEFTVFPMYRRRHLAVKAAEMIFERFKGKWEVKFNEKNMAAKALWNKATGKYRPQMTRLNDTETVLSFCSNTFEFQDNDPCVGSKVFFGEG